MPKTPMEHLRLARETSMRSNTSEPKPTEVHSPFSFLIFALRTYVGMFVSVPPFFSAVQ